MIYKKSEWDRCKKEWGFGKTYIDNFTDDEIVYKLFDECMSAPKDGWTVFTRSESRMEEFNDLISCPTAHNFTYNIMYSGEFIYELEQLTGIVGLLPDPHLVGAGFSIIRNGKDLGCHYDFNWNDRIKLHRRLTVMLYITPNWQEEWGGNIQYYDDNIDTNETATLIDSITPKFNRLVINENVKHKPYHKVGKVNSTHNEYPRCALRFFYYTSDSQPSEDNPPHRSKYKTNEYGHSKLY